MLLKIIFYLPGILAVIWEICIIQAPKEMTESLRNYNYRAATKGANGKSIATNMDHFYTFFMILYFLWCLVGLLSSQWIVFVLIMILGLMPKPEFKWGVRFLDALVTLGLLLFILLNAFHFHINNWEFLMSKIH